MHSSEWIAARRAELVSVATAMTNGELNLIEGVRRIVALRHDVGNPDDEIFMPIRAIESETDHFPIGAAREHWAPSHLKRVDAEIEQYLADVRSEIIEVCREIVRVYSQD